MSYETRSAVVYGIEINEDIDVRYDELNKDDYWSITEFLEVANIDYIYDEFSSKTYIGLVISDLGIDSLPKEIDYKTLETYNFEFDARIVPQIAKYIKGVPSIALRHIVYCY